MGGNLTNLITTFLSLKTFRGIKNKCVKIKNDILCPKSVVYVKSQYYSTHTYYLNPRYPSLFSGRKAEKWLKVYSDLQDDYKYDKLPKEFFESRGIKSGRVPFSYWFPLWIKHAYAFWFFTAIIVIFLIMCLVGIIITSFN